MASVEITMTHVTHMLRAALLTLYQASLVHGRMLIPRHHCKVFGRAVYLTMKAFIQAGFLYFYIPHHFVPIWNNCDL